MIIPLGLVYLMVLTFNNNNNYHRTCFVGCCNGLFSLHINDRVDHFSSNFSLWNPSTGDYRVIPTPPDDQIKGYNSPHDPSKVKAYGFGYDSKSDDYKFVCFTSYLKLNQSEVKIYSVRSGLWKRFKPTQNTPWLLLPRSPKYGVFCNGACHWQTSSSSEDLIALHMTDELVRGVSQPKTNFKKSGHTTCIDVVDGCLSMLYSNVNNLGFEVWVMKDYGKKESWTKLYSIPEMTSLEMGSYGRLRRIKCLKSGDILLEVCYNIHGANQKALVLYDPRSQTSTTFIEDEDEFMSNSLSFYSYVKSSVSVSSSTN